MRFLVMNSGPGKAFRTNHIARKVGVSKGVTLRNEDVKDSLESLVLRGFVDKVLVDDGGMAYSASTVGMNFWKENAVKVSAFFSFD